MEVLSITKQEANKKPHYPRRTVAKKGAEYKQAILKVGTQRQAAQDIGVPRTTLQHWLARQGQTGLAPEVETFFESPAGAAFLHQLFIAAHFVIAEVGPSGSRLFCTFLQLSQLDKIVGSSYGSIQKFSVQMEKGIVQFERIERVRLSKDMTQKKITTCQDETYHPEICLVAIEPVSNFILLEKYSEKRDALSWSLSMEEALQGLNVEIIQSTSDEGRGILKHVEESLGAHHSPDLFHVQYELSKGTAASLSAQVRQAENALMKAEQLPLKIQKDQEKYEYQKESRGPGRPPNFEEGIRESEEIVLEAKKALEVCITRKEEVSQAKRAIGEIYHPYNLENGTPCSQTIIKNALEKQFNIIETAAMSAGLSENSLKKIEKARRVVPQMVLTIVFFWLTVKEIVNGLNLDPDLKMLFHKNIIPAVYLKMAAKKISKAEKRKSVLEQAQRLMNETKDSPLWKNCDSEIQEKLEKAALQCASIFQRSSSCVEGRNGQLSLRHHSLHKLSERKLKASNTIHNYWIERSDGTTPAERFFESKPKDLFEWLLGHLNLPARPRSAKKRVEAIPMQRAA